MKFTLKWLTEYLTTSHHAEQIAARLSSVGLEVESIEDKKSVYEQFVVAAIEVAEKHPQADKLKVCVVNDGKQKLQIVCGAPNARSGIKVVLAPVGALIPATGMVIKKSQIRGIESQGMLCSARELALGEEAEGIMELPDNARIGQNFAEYAGLDDVVYDIALTPNRGDCASVYGIARDLAAGGLGELCGLPTAEVIASLQFPYQVSLESEEDCQEFCMRYIEGVDNKGYTSPLEKVEQGKKGIEENRHLKSIGLALKSPLVDISNFLMLSFGRPNHIYDAGKIEGRVTLRKSVAGEEFIALGGQAYSLPAGVLVVADIKKVLAVAGVIGGELSKVDEKTTNVLVEVAVFHPEAVAKAGRALNITTDSRFRFERRVDPGNTKFFMDYLTQEVSRRCGGQASEIVCLRGKNIGYKKQLEFEHQKLLDITGLETSQDRCIDILEKLGFRLNGNTLYIPSWRLGDVASMEDITEEIVRILGFEQVPEREISFHTAGAHQLYGPRAYEQIYHYKQRLRARGCDEAITWSFISPGQAEIFGSAQQIKLKNPISIDMSVMRPSILPGLLAILKKNIARGYENLSLFECGNIYAQDLKMKQDYSIAGIRGGLAISKGVHTTAREWNFYDVKEDVLTVLESARVNPQSLTFSRDVPSYYHPTRSAKITLGNKVLGYCGELHCAVLKGLDIAIPVVAFEIMVGNISASKEKSGVLKLSDYQMVSRDFAFIIEKECSAAEILKAISGLKNPLIIESDIFDVYEGKGVAAGHKSVAVNIKLQSLDKTLVDNEIEYICQQIIKIVQEKVGAVLRD